MIRSEIRSLAANFCGDPNLTRFSSTQYNDAIDRAQEEFCFDSKALYKDAATYTVTAADAAYDLPSDFWLERNVTHKGLELRPVSRETLLKNNGDDWSDDTGTPTHFMIDPEEARKQILLYPIPTADDAGANLILTYYPIPSELSADSSVPFNSSSLMSQFHMAIAAKAAWILLNYETPDPAIDAKMSKMNKIYQDKVTFAIDTYGNTKSEPMRMRGGRYW